MNPRDVFWKLKGLSDRQLLDRLGSVLGSSRRLTAELIAHLGEVEERRLHVAAACSSMFAYCLKLGMTEDEAYRRIEAARLARRYPAIFPLLADGQLTISAVALLKHHLSDDNHLELLVAASGKTVVQTRELIAARFPRPDVASCVRKLPERSQVMQPSLAMSAPTAPHGGGTEPHAGRAEPRGAEPRGGGAEPQGAEPLGAEPRGGKAAPAAQTPSACATRPAHLQSAAPPRVWSRIEPLSAQRYKVQFTASGELARKLELARDLMRHSHPDGELGPIVERALDLLIERLMQRRFGTTKKVSPKATRERPRHGDLAQQNDLHTTQGSAEPDIIAHRSAEPGTAPLETAASDTAAHAATTLGSVTLQGDHHGELTRPSVSSHIPRSARRTVVERDGLSCSWVDERGVRCGSRAWLEYDHRHPQAKGGGSEPENLRLLCRSHNRFAAEIEYGRAHVEQTIAERRRERPAHAM